MEDIVKLENIIKERVIQESISFFNYAEEMYGINIEISKDSFIRLNNNIYKIYETKQQVYKYETDMNNYLEMALLLSLKNRSYTIDKELILDSIYEVKTKNKDNYIKTKILKQKSN